MKVFFFTLIFFPSLLFGQHTISGTFSPAEDYKVLILYKVTPKESIYVANAEVNENGSFEIQLDSTMTAGIYKMVYALPQQDYNFDIIYNGKEDIELTFSNDTHVVYQKSTENKLLASYMHSMAMINNSINKFFTEKSTDTKALAAIFKTQLEAQTNFEEAAKGTIALNFIKANRPYIPEQEEDLKTYSKNLQIHFFDHIDFNNGTLQSSNFLKDRMFNYVFGISHKDIDKESGYKKNIDTFYKAMQNASLEIKSFLLLDLWQEMVDKGFDSVANYISETFLIAIAKQLDDTQLADALVTFKNTSIGAAAPDFNLEIEKQRVKAHKKMSELVGFDNYVVVFWSSTCSHCMEEIPELEAFVKSQETNKLQVIAIGLEDEPTTWKDMIIKFPDFIHVYGEGKWDNGIANSYNVHETPTYFVLNKDKLIVSKPDNFEALKVFFKK